MSSLQKFHRRTLTSGGYIIDTLVPIATVGDGSGNDTTGYYLGGFVGGIKLYVAPKTTEISLIWGSYGTTRGTTFVNIGLNNTNTLYAFGSTAHPAAYYCKTLTTGGYNTWYMPAKNELLTLYSNKTKTPFATANSFSGTYHWSSTESFSAGRYGAWIQNFVTGNQYDASGNGTKSQSNYVRAVRRSTI